jgi:hydroxyethylthiazole kinase
MPYVTGTGARPPALIGAFHAVDKDPLVAAATALAFFGIAGESAGNRSAGPGSFMIHLLDALYTLTPEEVETRCRIEKI